jgi:hypothetical protein
MGNLRIYPKYLIQVMLSKGKKRNKRVLVNARTLYYLMSGWRRLIQFQYFTREPFAFIDH